MLADDGGTRPPDPVSTVELAPGEQAIAIAPSTASVLDALPTEAFENLLVVTVRQPAYVERLVRERGFDPRRIGVVPIAASPTSYDGPMWTSRPVSPSDLTGVSIETGRGLGYVRRGAGWLYVDGVTTLLMYAREERVFRLVDSLVQQARSRDVRGIYAFSPGVASEQTLARFRGFADAEFVLDE